MVIFIGGESHTGKTLFSQNLMQRTHIPYTSLDHIKMGLIRAGRASFSASSPDQAITPELWGIVKGIADTCLENRQHIILEGCYLPPEEVGALLGQEVMALYLIFSQAYLERAFEAIRLHENAIEWRKHPMEGELSQLIVDHGKLKSRCGRAGVPFVEIDRCYETEMAQALDQLCEQIFERLLEQSCRD